MKSRASKTELIFAFQEILSVINNCEMLILKNTEQSWRTSGAFEWSLTLKLPRSGITQTVLIQ